MGLCWRRGRDRRGRLQQRLQHIHIARRRRHTDLRSLAQAQRKLQLVPSLLPALPFRQFIHPSRIKLRPAQPFGVMRRMHRGDCPIRPNQPLPRRPPTEPPLRRAPGPNSLAAHNNPTPPRPKRPAPTRPPTAHNMQHPADPPHRTAHAQHKIHSTQRIHL